MAKRLRRYIQNLERAETLEGLRLAITAAVDLFGLDCVLFRSFRPIKPPFCAGSIAGFAKRSYSMTPDRHMWLDSRPVDWSDIDWTGPDADFYTLGMGARFSGFYGLSSVVFRNSRIVGMMVWAKKCTNDVWSQTNEGLSKDMNTASYCVDGRLAELSGEAEYRNLGHREKELLRLVCQGFEGDAVAKEMQLRPIEARIVQESARFKLNAMDINHAAKRAMTLGLLE